MKKILALMLVLCMALAAIPAMAEDFSGDWYIVLGNVSAGTLVMNADGTCSLSMSFGEEIKQEGTWVADGDKVTITIDNSPAEFTFDGTTLSTELAPLSFSREPGKVTVEQVMAYMETNTLPEGVTEDEMAEALVSIMSIAFTGADTGTTETPAEPAATEDAPVLTVLDENYIVKQGYSGEEHWVYLTLQNETDSILYINTASLTMTDAEGNEAGKADYLYSAGSRYLEPGEITYISLQAKITEGMTPVSYSYSVESKEPNDWTTKDFAVESGTPELTVVLKEAGSYENKLQVKVSVTNTADEPIGHVSIFMVLKDSDGKVLDMGTESLYNMEIGANSTIILTDNFSSSTADYCINEGVTPAEVEVYARWEDSGF